MNEAEEKITYAESDQNYARTSAVDNYTENMGTTIAGDDPMVRLTKVTSGPCAFLSFLFLY